MPGQTKPFHPEDANKHLQPCLLCLLCCGAFVCLFMWNTVIVVYTILLMFQPKGTEKYPRKTQGQRV